MLKKSVQGALKMPSRSNSIKFISYNNGNEVVDKLVESILSRYGGNFETSMRGSYLIFESVQLLYYKCNEVNFKCGGSYIGSPYCIKK